MLKLQFSFIFLWVILYYGCIPSQGITPLMGESVNVDDTDADPDPHLDAAYTLASLHKSIKKDSPYVANSGGNDEESLLDTVDKSQGDGEDSSTNETVNIQQDSLSNTNSQVDDSVSLTTEAVDMKHDSISDTNTVSKDVDQPVSFTDSGGDQKVNENDDNPSKDLEIIHETYTYKPSPTKASFTGWADETGKTKKRRKTNYGGSILWLENQNQLPSSSVVPAEITGDTQTKILWDRPLSTIYSAEAREEEQAKMPGYGEPWNWKTEN